MDRFPFARPGRGAIVVLMLILLTGLLSSGLVQAQNANKINLGDTVTGTIDGTNFTRTYVYDGKAGDVITITVTSQTKALAVAVVVTNADGVTVGQGINAPTIKDLKLATDGLYYITITRSTGITGATGNFTL